METGNFDNLRMQSRFYYECVLADGKQFDLCEVWDKMNTGDELFLTRDMVNMSNPNAVAVLFKDPEKDNYTIIGRLPKTEKSEDIASILDLGWDNQGGFFSCRIMHKDFKDSEFQLRLSIRIKRMHQ